MYTPYEKRARTGNKQHGSEVGKACSRYLFFRILPAASIKMSSRHFHHHDLKKSLNGIVTLKEEAVPSKFPSFEDSAKKRKPPTLRESPPTKVVKTAHALELKTSSSMTQTTCDAENVVGLAEDDEAIKERLTQLETELRTTLEAKEKLEQEHVQLQTMSALDYKKNLAESRAFTLGHFTSDKDFTSPCTLLFLTTKILKQYLISLIQD